MSEGSENPLSYLTTEAADNDLIEIGFSLRTNSQRAAEAFVRQVDKTLELISRFPEMGRRCDEFASDLRSFVVDRYVLFYRVTSDNRVLVIRVIHGMRDLPSILMFDMAQEE